LINKRDSHFSNRQKSITPLWQHARSKIILKRQQTIQTMSTLNLKDAIRELIPGVELFDSDDLDQLTVLLCMEYSIKTTEELRTRFVCSKQLIWTDDKKVEIDGCESFEFNELLIYIKEIDRPAK